MDGTKLPKKPARWPVVVTFFVAAILWAANWNYALMLPSGERGTFGDMFGAVNSLFSGFAFVGVIYAITMQRHEISIARQDIRYTKEILDDQKAQLIQQNQEAKKQTFEATFFQLVRLLSDITNQIDIQRLENGVSVITRGKDVFPVFLKRLKKAYEPMATALYGGMTFKKHMRNFTQSITPNWGTISAQFTTFINSLMQQIFQTSDFIRTLSELNYQTQK